MKIYLISDNVDTQTGLRLVGISGCVAHGHDEVNAALDAALADEELAVLLVTDKAAEKVSARLDEIKLTQAMPLVVVIPDRHGSQRPKDYITAYVRDAIGVKL